MSHTISQSPATTAKRMVSTGDNVRHGSYIGGMMDPHANTREQLELATNLLKLWDNADEATGENTPDEMREIRDNAFRLAELVDALAEWNRRNA